MSLVLVLGGTRSGKTAIAEELVARAASAVTYIATASADDPEMAARIAAHRLRRPASWTTIDAGDEPAFELAHVDDESAVLLDGLGAWIAGVLHRRGALADHGRLDEATEAVRDAVGRLADVAAARPGLTVVVAEEAGLAPVAADPGTRRWVDLAGESAQRLAAEADRVLLVVAGRALDLPPASAPAPLARSAEPPPAPQPRPLHGDRMVPQGFADHAVNVLADGPPPWLARALQGALDEVGRYPDARPAAAAVGTRHGRAPEDVLVLNGAAEGFWLLAVTLAPRRAVVLSPSFTEPISALRAHGVEPLLLPRAEHDRWAVHPEAVPDDADLVYVCNPCNPTGVLHPAGVLAALTRPGRTVVVDESFMDLVPGEAESLAGAALDGLVVLRSLTKSLSVPGVRVGYLLAEPRIVAALDRMRQAWPVNVLALAALQAWASRETPAAERAKAVAADRERLAAGLAGLPGVHVVPGAANFLLIRVPDGGTVRARLADQRIAVRPTADLGLDDDHLRIAVRGGEADARLVRALRTALEC
jgi:histidinol-phosphate/aromatic aminotransferase/cobyric acid decarboxylase-like protein/adenosyl cobinamide kinase/adenosyl cobinamide phosphate guanylyltransferase